MLLNDNDNYKGVILDINISKLTKVCLYGHMDVDLVVNARNMYVCVTQS